MKTRLTLSALAILAVAAFGTPVFAQCHADALSGFGFGVGGFIDENGDGFNDLAPDADGDGIPNGLDPDYAPPADGTGYQFGNGTRSGDGTCDGENQAQGLTYNFKHQEGNGFGPGGNNDTLGFGPGDGTGNDGEGPGDGTGFGPGDGTCTPQGLQKGPERLN